MRMGQKPLYKHFKIHASFFFLFTIIVTLVNPGINRQIRLQRDRVQTGREGRHLWICSAAPAGQTAVLPAGTGEEPFPRGASSPFGVWRADYMHLGLSSGGLSERLAVMS